MFELNEMKCHRCDHDYKLHHYDFVIAIIQCHLPISFNIHTVINFL